MREFTSLAASSVWPSASSPIACGGNPATSSKEEDEEFEEESDEEWVAPVMSRFSFRARRPFHPARLHKLLKRGRLDGVIRSSGVIWIATQPHSAIAWHQVRRQQELCRLIG